MSIVRGIDSDNYDGPVPASHYKRLYDEYAVRFNILGLEARQPYVEAQKQASAEAGLWVPFGYKFLYWVPTDLENMKQACRSQLPIAIDCERTTNWEPGRVLNRILQAREALLAEGLYWGIYTGKPWWQQYTGDAPIPEGDSLWHASWPYGEGILPPPTYLPESDYSVKPALFYLPDMIGVGPYGGRHYAQCWQYANVCYLDDLGEWDFDMNAMWMDGAAPPSPPPEQPVGSFFAGDIHGGLEKRPGQVVLWNDGKPVFAWGDPEGEGIGRIAKRFGERWEWLRRVPNEYPQHLGARDAYWDEAEGD